MNTKNRVAYRLAGALGVAALSLVITACGSSPQTNETKSNSAVNGQYAFWPLFPDEPRIQFVRSLATSEDVAPTKTSGLETLVFGAEAGKAEAIKKPYGIEMRDGKIYVCDIRAPGLTILDLRKKQTRLVGVSGVNRLSHPVDVAVADDGMIYVADNERGAIVVYDAAERYTEVFGFQKFKPVSVAVHGDRLYACDITSQSVQIFDRKSGAKLGEFGTPGDADGQFRVPIGVDTDKAGNVYVVDTMRCRVQKFDPEGKFISGMGQLGDYAGSFARPKQIAVDSEGIQYVVDSAFQNVQMFNDKDQLLMSFGATGTFPGAMNLPVGIAVSDDSLDLFKDMVHPGFEPRRVVVVSNQFGDKTISVYVMGKLRAGWTAQQVAAASIPVSAGVGTSPGRLELQMQGESPEPLPAEGGGEGEGAGDESGTPPAAVPEKPAANRPK